MLLTRLLIFSTVLLFAGCGYNPDSDLYNIQLNAEEFPPEALALIDGVQTGRLSAYDSLIETFSNLYINHTELLDDPEWIRVVERMGVRFRVRGDEWVTRGMPAYAEAARFYDLASQARLGDERVRRKRDLFMTWARAVDDNIVPPGFDPTKDTLPVGELLDLLKYFLLGDSLHREFGQNHLMPQIFGARSIEKTFTLSASRGLTSADKAFLTHIGVRKEPIEGSMVKLTDPHVDLVAARIDKQDNHWYAAELYFIPRDTLTVNYSVAVQIAAPSADNSASFLGPHLLAFDFRPEIPTTQWPVGKVAAVYRRFLYHGEPSPVAVGLYDKQGDSVRYLRMEHSGEPLHILPASVFVQ